MARLKQSNPPLPEVPAELGKLLYAQPIDVASDIKQRVPGSVISIIIALFGVAMGLLFVYATLTAPMEDYYLLVAVATLSFSLWTLWTITYQLRFMWVGYVCTHGVGAYQFHRTGRVAGHRVHCFTPETRMGERRGRTGPIANIRTCWSLEFYEGSRFDSRRKQFTITAANFDRDGYGYAEADDPDFVWYAMAKQAYLNYKNTVRT